MNYAYLHIATNHIPIVGNACGLFILILGYCKKNSEFKKASLWIFLLTGLATIPTYFSGHRAAHIVADLPGVSREMIGPHAQAGFYGAIALGVLGLLSLIGLWLGRSNREIPKGLTGILLLLSLVIVGWAGYVANLGGQIHHQEARKDFKVPQGAEEGGSHAIDSD